MNTLDLSKKELPSIPLDIMNAIQQPDYFSVLIAQQCKTQSLTPFNGFHKLLALDLSNNNLGTFVKTKTLSGLFLLKALVMQRNEITTISDHFLETTKNIQLLDLGFNKLTKVPKCIGSLNGLTTLNLTSNQIMDLEAFRYYKQRPLNSLQFIGLQNNPIENIYAQRFEESLMFYFPKLTFVLTRFCQQKDKQAFLEILEMDYYTESDQLRQEPVDCSFNNDSDELLKLIEPIKSSAKRSRRSTTSPDSRFGSSRKPQNLRRALMDRKRELNRLDAQIEVEGIRRDELQTLHSRYKSFLRESLQVGDSSRFDDAMNTFTKFSTCIDIINPNKTKQLVSELIKTVKDGSLDDIDAQLMAIEEIIRQMNTI